jgi:hypothetical protein
MVCFYLIFISLVIGGGIILDLIIGVDCGKDPIQSAEDDFNEELNHLEEYL